MNTISPESLHQLRAGGKDVDLIDVRTPVEFEQVHVDFARNIPIDMLDPDRLQRERHQKDEPVYVICKMGGRGRQACEKLNAAGVRAVNVEGGTQSWEAAGLPVQRGTGKVISLERQVRIAAGLLVLLGVILGTLVHPAFYGLAAFIGAGLVFAGVSDWCGMALLLAKMPWNQRTQSNS